MLFSLIATLSAQKAAGQEPYVVISDETTLTFYYDNQRSDNNGILINDYQYEQYPKWIIVEENNGHLYFKDTDYTKVVFDKSFKSARPTSCAFWFYYCSKITNIEGIDNLITSDVTEMKYMFAMCSSLTSLDVSEFDTKKVTDMKSMFQGCSSLSRLDVSGFNTEKVTNMSGMFQDCNNLTNLNISGIKTTNVEDMHQMFMGCNHLSAIDLSGFQTDKVTDMNSMFYNCNSLNDLNVSGFNTENVTDMSSMFYKCSSLTTIDLRSFTTNNVDIRGMFGNCKNLTTILVSGEWKTENILTSFSDGWDYGPFAESPNLIGNTGTLNSSDVTTASIQFACIDDTANGTPGYFTTDSYKIFYDLDGNGEIDNVDQYEWGNILPQNFDIDNRNSTINIPNLNQKGKTFIGWIRTPITGLTEPTKGISIAPEDKGNRIYTAVWGDKEAYVVASKDNTLTFYYDTDQTSKSTEENTTYIYSINELNESGLPAWINETDNPYQKVIFDDSFKEFRPTTCEKWFYHCSNITKSKG